MHLTRAESPAPILYRTCAKNGSSIRGQIESVGTSIGHKQENMSSSSSSITSNTSRSDRNHVRGLLLTTADGTSTFSKSTTFPTSTSSGVIVATTETSKAVGNKKTIEHPVSSASTSFTRKAFYPTQSAGNNVNTDSNELHASSRLHEQAQAAEEGVWQRLSTNELEKSPSQDSIIVQSQTPRTTVACVVDEEKTPTPEDELATSIYSNTSTGTVIKRFETSSRSNENSNTMNDLPSYELASAYVKSNLYAQMSNPKNAQNSNAASTTSGASVTTNQPQSNSINQSQSYDKLNHYDQSPSSPRSKLAMVTSASAYINQQQRQANMARESSLEPIGEEERLVQMTQAVLNSQPSRSKRAEVLRYFAAARAFQIRVVGGDIQITDSEGCPLFDAFQELDCRQRWWNIEAYGDRVLLMREELSFGDGSSSWGSRVTITDWNGELFGYLITGDPLRLESAERVGIGRFSSQPAVVNNAACSNATSIPKACWVCQTTGDDGREQIVARLEAYQRIVFLADGNMGAGNQQNSNFHLKLMALAGVIRLVGAMTVTPVSDCLALTKFFCNCCAYK